MSVPWLVTIWVAGSLAWTVSDIVQSQQQMAQQLQADVAPFEVRVDLAPEEIRAGRISSEVQTLFDADGNDVDYVRAVGLPADVGFTVDRAGFVLVECYHGGATPPADLLARYANCGQPTGQAEARDWHRPRYVYRLTAGLNELELSN